VSRDRGTTSGAARAALADVCRGFLGDEVADTWAEIAEGELPAAARGLLAHHEHMTRVLERHYGRRVALRVLAEQRGDRHYARNILLVLEGTDQIVEFGIARLDLSAVSPAVQREVLDKTSPLGEILIRHDVLRRIEPRAFFRIPGGTRIAQAFGDAPPDRGVYGRLGTIYCDEEPAVDLLEVVAVRTEATGAQAPGAT
jgi:chorismate-pyruvate lyase